MDKKSIKRFSRSLEKDRERLLQKLKRTRSEVESPEDKGRDDVDEANAELALSESLWRRTRDNALLTKIEEALDRIESGEYGACEHCGDPIGKERLKISPFAKLCIECKASSELMEKQYADRGLQYKPSVAQAFESEAQQNENNS